MLRMLFQGIEDILTIFTFSSPQPVGHYGFSFSDRSRLVQYQQVNLPGNLQAFCILDQNALSGTLSDTHHDGRGRGKSQCTGTGNDQYGDQCQQSVSEPVGIVQYVP